jgi:hypothetical protein
MDARGLALVDIVCGVAITLVMAAIAVPVVGATLDRERTIVGTNWLAGQAQRAKAEAVRQGRTVAIKLALAGGRTRVQLFADGNGNGVLQKDIDRGLDPPITVAEWLDDHARQVSLGLNQDVPDPSGTELLSRGGDPLRIGPTTLVAFSPTGTSTSGTLYVSAATGPQMAIRLYGATSRVRVLMFLPHVGRWQP